MINLYVFLFGGFGYGILEVLWRGYTHVSMLIVGGLCALLIWNTAVRLKELSLFKKSLLCCMGITAVELVSGIILNQKMGLHVWDYSAMKYNIGGQVCLYYTLMWFLLSMFLIKICDMTEIKNKGEGVFH